MKERPIIQNGPQVRAILDGRKTQTRRVISKHNSVLDNRQRYSEPVWDGLDFEYPKCPAFWLDGSESHHGGAGLSVSHPARGTRHRITPRWQVGMNLWVREPFSYTQIVSSTVPGESGMRGVIYKASPNNYYPHKEEEIKWKPSIHMPRWASRITLEVTHVRAERVQEISNADAVVEGTPIPMDGDKYLIDLCGPATDRHPTVAAFGVLWNSINKSRGYEWKSNPWVFVLEFKRIDP